MLAVHLTDFGDVRVLQIWFTDSDPCRLPILDSGEDLSQDHNREMSDFQLECVHLHTVLSNCGLTPLYS